MVQARPALLKDRFSLALSGAFLVVPAFLVVSLRLDVVLSSYQVMQSGGQCKS